MLPSLLLHSGHEVSWSAWHFEPTVDAGALLVAGLYSVSIVSSRAFSWPRIACFSLGALAMLTALASPLDAGAERLLSLHMLQHVILTSIGPPLVLLGLAPAQIRPLLGSRRLSRAARAVTNPLVAAALFVVNMWFWHVPAVYQTALNDLPVHVAMHVAFMGTGLLFWWPVVQPLPELSRLGEGARLLYLFVSGFPMGLLALLLLASGSVVYDYYEEAPRLWGISPLADQQIAAIIMGSLGEIAAFIALSYLFFRFLDREEEASEASPRPGSASAP